MKIEVKAGMSLLDAVLWHTGKIDTIIEVARKNNLPLDYCFENSTEIEIEEDIIQNYECKYSTAEEEKKVKWILNDGYWEDKNIWIDEEYWKD